MGSNLAKLLASNIQDMVSIYSFGMTEPNPICCVQRLSAVGEGKGTVVMKVLGKICVSVVLVLFVTGGLCYAQNTAEEYFTKGVEYGAQGKFEEAKKEFEKALEADPFHINTEVFLGIIEDVNDEKIKSKIAIHLFKVWTYKNEDKWDEAISELDKAIKLNPKYAKAYQIRGVVYLKGKGQYDKAISDYTRAIEINPKLAIAYNNRGFVYIGTGEYDKAISDYTRAIEINPKDAYAYKNRGFAYAEGKGYCDEGISDYTKAIEINPKDAYAYNNRGLAYECTGQYDKAIADYSRTIELNPYLALPYLNRAAAYFYHKEEYDKAWEDVHKAQSLGLGNVRPVFLRALREASGLKEQSGPEYGPTYKLRFPAAEYYFGRGRAYYHEGQYDKAISDYTKAIEINPKYAEVYFKRGFDYYHTGQYDKAISDYTKAIEINPKYADAYTNRGIAYDKKGHYDEAISDFTEAIELNPYLPVTSLAYVNRAVTYYHKEEYDKAWEDVHRAQSLGLQIPPEFLKMLREASGREK